MATTRINGRDLVVLIDSIDRSDETTSVTFGYGTRQTFTDMRGSIPKRLDMTILQDLATGSLYKLAMAGGGAQVTGVLKPLGNAAPSVTQPHYSFNVTPSGPTGDAYIGGDAAEDGSQTLTVEVQWLITDWLEVTA
ncbi:hypothetical protein [Occultella gossypii]|uniref:Uncharacterized protein n=1 Tax=Occultella gossypii TaxID=2800820 RepID=A0ABS7SDC7_9MICO|nr:hypothetical protein [Occultella gossypii]MBZ2197273.1 hypothetical protein [Occultella gossypii]